MRIVKLTKIGIDVKCFTEQESKIQCYRFPYILLCTAPRHSFPVTSSEGFFCTHHLYQLKRFHSLGHAEKDKKKLKRRKRIGTKESHTQLTDSPAYTLTH